MTQFNNNLAYEASAGSGKTFMLVVRYLSLLFKGAEPSKILALTFTNKAANEMQERIVLTLQELQNRGELDEIVKVTQLSKDYILQQRSIVLSEFLNSHTKIMTIDSFFTQILRKFSLYTSLMPDFSTFSSQHELKLLSRFLKEVDVAGKTNTLIHLALESKKRLSDIFMLLNQFYEKKQELSTLRFTKQDTLGFEYQAMQALEELQNIINQCDKASSTLKKAVEAKSFEELSAKSWIGRETLDYRTFTKCFTLDMNRILTTIQEAIKKQNKAREQNFFYALMELVSIYEKAKKALYVDDGELSFSDVSILVHYLLKERIDSEFLYFRLDAHIEHMLLDEFQDTSIIQYEILKPLIDEILSGEGVFNDGSFFFVGDVKQSIYRFRGGVSALFATVKDQCGTKVEPLLRNYRSQKEIIEFVNRSFKSKIKNYENQLSSQDSQAGYVEMIQNNILIQEMITQVKRLIDFGYNINEIAVLCATNGDGEVVKEALEKDNIEVVTETTTKLINQKSVKAILEYLKYQYFKKDIYRYNFFSLIDQDVEVLKFINFNTIKLIDSIKNIIEKYELFSDDFHLLRFLNVVRKYQDIEALLFEYERLDTTAAMSDLRGVRVLTIHKSKGLEYENVIVLDRLKKAPPARDSIIYEYDGIYLKNIYLRIKGRDKLDREYEDALLKEKSLVYEDSLNALYVAFTRAKENLFILQKSKDSMFEMLEFIPSSYGVLSKNINKNSFTKIKLQTLKYKDLYYGTQSDILSLEDTKEEDLASQNFGIAMHYMLEMLGDFTQDSLINAKDMMLNKYGGILTDIEVKDIVNRIEMLLKDRKFLELIEGTAYKEKALRYNNNLRYIDLLIHKPEDNYIVIDYKSSISYAQDHKKQVEYYVDAIKNITHKKTQGYICYLLENEIKIVISTI